MRNLDVLQERPVPLSELRRLVPSVPGYDGVHRWCKKGLPATAVEGAPRVTLEWAYQGKMVTSVAAYYRFIARLNGELEIPAEGEV